MSPMRTLTALLLAVGITLGFAATASAVDQEEVKCYEEVTIYGDIIEKETHTKTSNDYGRTWSDYGPWTDWPDAGPLNDDGRNRGPAFHGEDDQGRDRWYRQYRYVVKGQFVKGTEEVEVACPTLPPETTAAPTTTVAETTTTVAETTTTVAETTTTVAETSTTAPVTTQPATTAPTTTQPIVPAVEPVLPSTGSENWIMAVIAGLLILAGTTAVRFARRS